MMELMSVVAIIGVLLAITVPNFMKFVYKSRRSEAFFALKGIHTAQKSYEAEANGFADTFLELGFDLTASALLDDRTLQGPFYTYTVMALTQDGRPRANFRATAVGDIDPRDPDLDILVIENQLTIVDGPS